MEQRIKALAVIKDRIRRTQRGTPLPTIHLTGGMIDLACDLDLIDHSEWQVLHQMNYDASRGTLAEGWEDYV